jgi:hypothetical protein
MKLVFDIDRVLPVPIPHEDAKRLRRPTGRQNEEGSKSWRPMRRPADPEADRLRVSSARACRRVWTECRMPPSGAQWRGARMTPMKDRLQKPPANTAWLA